MRRIFGLFSVSYISYKSSYKILQHLRTYGATCRVRTLKDDNLFFHCVLRGFLNKLTEK